MITRAIHSARRHRGLFSGLEQPSSWQQGMASHLASSSANRNYGAERMFITKRATDAIGRDRCQGPCGISR
jgi:hypothetical protein